MKQTCLALALLGAFACTANAQSNVIVYGLLDAGVARINNGAVTTTRLDSGNNSGSRLGFRGSEDLGSGLSAVFTLENGFGTDNGTQLQGGRLFGRQAWVGLSSHFGTLKLGRQNNPARGIIDRTDPYNLAGAGRADTIFNVYGDRADNSLTYTTPNLRGLIAQVAYDFGEQPGNSTLGRQLGMSADYAVGPLNASLGYHKQNQLTLAGAGNGSTHTTLVAGMYDFNVVKLHAMYATNKGASAAGVRTVDQDDMMLGLSIPFGPHRLYGSYLRRSNDLLTNADTSVYSIAYTYDLSKRTNLYASYGNINNETAATINSPGAGAIATAGADPSVLYFGLRHRF